MSKESFSKIDLNDSESVYLDNGEKSVAYFCKKLPAKVTNETITELKDIFKTIGNKNLRLCLHDSPAALAHEMIIFERQGKYYRPHKHLTKGETFHIIEGKLAVFSFDDHGQVIDVCFLSREANLIYRVQVDMYHAVMPLTDFVIYHESKPGPFLGQGDSLYPSWAPAGSEPGAVKEYSDHLKQEMDKYGR